MRVLSRTDVGLNSIKNLSRGSKVYLPVHVPGAKFSVGDLHFSRKLAIPPSCRSLRRPALTAMDTKQRATARFPSAAPSRWLASSP